MNKSSTIPYGLINAEILFISERLITIIITITIMYIIIVYIFQNSIAVIFNYTVLSIIIIMCLQPVIWFQTFLSLLVGSALSVTIIVIGYGIGDLSSNPERVLCFPFLLIPSEKARIHLLLPNFGNKVELTRFF